MSNHSFLLRRSSRLPRDRGEPAERFLGRGANTLGCRIHFIPNPSFRPSDFEFPNKFDRRRRRRRLVELASLRDGKIASLLARRKATSPLSSSLSRHIHPHPPFLSRPSVFVSLIPSPSFSLLSLPPLSLVWHTCTSLLSYFPTSRASWFYFRTRDCALTTLWRILGGIPNAARTRSYRFERGGSSKRPKMTSWFIQRTISR